VLIAISAFFTRPILRLLRSRRVYNQRLHASDFRRFIPGEALMRHRLEKQEYQKDITNLSAHFFPSHGDPGQGRLQIAPAPLQFLPDDTEE
jgi:hypothetical protein